MCALGREADAMVRYYRPLTVQRRMLTESLAGFLAKVDDLAAKRVFVVEVGDFCTAFRPETIYIYIYIYIHAH